MKYIPLVFVKYRKKLNGKYSFTPPCLIPIYSYGYSVYLHNGINRAGLLAEATVDALGHINVIACSSPAAVSASLSLDGDGLSTTRDGKKTQNRGEVSHSYHKHADTHGQLQRCGPVDIRRHDMTWGHIKM